MRGEWIEISHFAAVICSGVGSLPMRGEWIEICLDLARVAVLLRSLPMRGEWIEIAGIHVVLIWIWSLPMRGEWIEISPSRTRRKNWIGLSPCGESGLKSPPLWGSPSRPCLSPCGESGLKCRCDHDGRRTISLSPCGESGLKYKKLLHYSAVYGSLPMRGEWIEITYS